jgi:hypothetical protein
LPEEKDGLLIYFTNLTINITLYRTDTYRELNHTTPITDHKKQNI